MVDTEALQECMGVTELLDMAVPTGDMEVPELADMEDTDVVIK